MDQAERDLFGAIIRSSLILTMIVAIPVGVVTGLLGPIIGLAAFAAAIPFSAHMGRAAPLGEDMDTALDRVRSDIIRIAKVVGLSAVLGINVIFLVPDPISAIPFLSLLVMSHFSIALYVLGLNSHPDRLGPDLAVPVVMVSLVSLANL